LEDKFAAFEFCW